MIKRLVLLFLLFGFICCAQESKEKELSQARNYLISAEQAHQKQDFELAFSLGKRAVLLYQKLGNNEGEGNCFKFFGKLAEIKSQHSKAIEYYQKAMELYEKAQIYREKNFLLKKLSLLYSRRGNLIKATELSQQHLEWASSQQDLTEISIALNNLGLNFLQQRKFKKALEYHQKALQIRKGLGKNALVGNSLSNIGMVYFRLGNPSQALHYMQESLLFYEKENPHPFEYLKSLDNIGAILLRAGDFTKAIKFFTKGFQASQKMQQNILPQRISQQVISQQIIFLWKIGQAHSSLGDEQTSFIFYENALKISQQTKQPVFIANSLNYLGSFYQRKRDFSKASRYFEEALKHYEALNYTAAIAIVVSNLGAIYQEQGFYEEALAQYKKSLNLAQKTKRPESLITAWTNLGSVYILLKKNDKAFKALRQAQRVLEITGNTFRHSGVYNDIARIYAEEGNYEAAMEYHQKALRIRQRGKNPTLLANTLNNIGLIFHQKGEYQKALEHFQQAQHLLKGKELSPEFSKILVNLGVIYFEQGELGVASKYYQAAMEIRKKLLMFEGIAELQNKMALIMERKGDFQKAIKFEQHYLKTMKKLGRPSGVASALNNLGMMLLKQEVGKEQALNYFQQSLKIREELKDTPKIAESLGSIGNYYLQKKEYGKSLEYFQKSLDFRKKMKTPATIAKLYNDIGVIYVLQQDYKEALKYCLLAQETLKRVNDSTKVARNLATIGNIYYSIKEHDRSLLYYQASLKLLEGSANLNLLLEAHHKIANLLLLKREFDKVKPHYFAMGKILNTLLLHKFSDRQATLGHYLTYYHELIRFLIRTNETEAAFYFMQHYKALGFLTQLEEFANEIESSVHLSVLKEKETIIAKISVLQEQIFEFIAQGDINSQKINSLKKLLTQQEQKLQQLLNHIRLENSAYYDIKYPHPIKLKELQALLNPGEVFLDFFCPLKISGVISEAFCFIIGKNFSKVVAVGKTKHLNGMVEQFRQTIWDSQKNLEPYEYLENTMPLYETLLTPILEVLKDREIKQLIIAPDEKLSLLAFEALCIPGKGASEYPSSYEELHYLLDDYQVSYTLSATVFRELLQRFSKQSSQQATISFFGIGDPLFKSTDTASFRTRTGLSSLPSTRIELEKIASFFPVKRQKIFLQEEATEPNIFLTDLSQYSILHFATHGLIDTAQPMYSALALTPLSEEKRKSYWLALKQNGLEPKSASDGFLQVRDILKLHHRLKAELVVLSACETASGKIKRGDGIIGLSRAFHFAGASSIIVSLWSVADESTSKFMIHFYQELLKDNPQSLKNRKIKSLHYSKKQLRFSREYCAPYYWAPFILRGLF